MTITINTDGSYNQWNGKSGYAFWITCNTGRYKRHGELKKATCSMQTEIMAIANALAFIDNNKESFEGTTRIIMNTDCQSVADVINGKGKFKKKDKKELIAFIRKKLGNIPFEARHVKAHTSKKDSRSFVNRWLDKHARMHVK